MFRAAWARAPRTRKFFSLAKKSGSEFLKYVDAFLSQRRAQGRRVAPARGKEHGRRSPTPQKEKASA